MFVFLVLKLERNDTYLIAVEQGLFHKRLLFRTIGIHVAQRLPDPTECSVLTKKVKLLKDTNNVCHKSHSILPSRTM